jgi:peptide deformylase
MPKHPPKPIIKAADGPKAKVPGILQSGDPILHTPAKEVILADLQGAETQRVLADMTTALWMDGEGCLSVRWLYGKVYRSTRVTLEYYNEKGQKKTRGASGILAHIFQHEVDHLNGILFTDKAKDLKEFDPDEIRKEARLAKKRRSAGLDAPEDQGVEVDDDAEFESNEM